MKSMSKLYIVLFFLLSDFVVFAQPPTDDEGDDLQDEDAPAMFLNRRIVWLVIAGICLAIYKFRKYNQQISKA